MSAAQFLAAPTVSVCLASYNGERFIAEQVESILAQMGASDELIISDNGSTDSTAAVLAGLADSRIRWVQCDRKGVVANFENALLHASKDLVVLSDQDDVWLAGRLAAARAALQRHDLAMVGLRFVNEKLEPMTEKLLVREPVLSLRSTLIRNGYTGCCMAFRRDLLQQVLPLPPGLPMHDWWIASVALATGADIHLSKEPLILYRRHGDNASVTGQSSGVGFAKQVAMRLKLVSSLLGRVLRLRWASRRPSLRTGA